MIGRTSGRDGACSDGAHSRALHESRRSAMLMTPTTTPSRNQTDAIMTAVFAPSNAPSVTAAACQ